MPRNLLDLPPTPGPERKYLTAYGAYDLRAIRGEIRAQLADKQDFINGWSGDPRKFWEAQIRLQVIARVIDAARYERSSFIFDRAEISYTTAEINRLRDLALISNPLTATMISHGQFTPEYYAARIEKEQMATAAWKRAEAVVIAKIRSDAKLANVSRLSLQAAE